jgi:hypothetical protein
MLKNCVAFLCISILLPNCFAEDTNQSSSNVVEELNWLYGNTIEYFNLSLNNKELPESAKEMAKFRAHQFAFDYWLFTRAQTNSRPTLWKYHVRKLLHNQAKSQKHFDDPASVSPFFTNGTLIKPLFIKPMRWIDLNRLSEGQYRALVAKYQLVYCDFTEVFSVEPKPTLITDPKAFTTFPKEAKALQETLNNREWVWLTLSRIPVDYRFSLDLENNPIFVFNLLNVDSQAYFLPAFLRMCEMNVEKIGELPSQLLEALASDSYRSVELCSKFTEFQKKCIAAFFEDWFGVASEKKDLLKKLNQKLGVNVN